VAIGLAIAVAAHASMSFPASHPLGLLLIPGAVLLGIGARLNGACMIGTIARLGSGQWSFALTPLGFFLGQAVLLPVAPMPRMRSPGNLPNLFIAPLMLVPALLFITWRMTGFVRAARRRRLSSHLWSTHGATAVIGLCFVALMLAVGPWAYTEILADLAAGRMTSEALRASLIVPLVLGAVLAGATAGTFRSELPNLRSAGRRLAGGCLIGAGSLIVPGGNDRLLLVGIPLAQPYAWGAVAIMTITIAVIPLCGTLARPGVRAGAPGSSGSSTPVGR
jgi:toxin CptA